MGNEIFINIQKIHCTLAFSSLFVHFPPSKLVFEDLNLGFWGLGRKGEPQRLLGQLPRERPSDAGECFVVPQSAAIFHCLQTRTAHTQLHAHAMSCRIAPSQRGAATEPDISSILRTWRSTQIERELRCVSFYRKSSRVR